MKTKIKNKKKFNFLIVILREEILGHKDIDHILPFVYFLNKSKTSKFTTRCLILENEINYRKNLDPRVKMLFNFKNMDKKFLYKSNFIFYIKLLSELKINQLFFRFLKRVMRYFYIKHLIYRKNKVDIKSKLGENFIRSNSPVIITAHANNEARNIVSNIKKFNKKAKWMVLPDGIMLTHNKMNVDTNLEKNEKKKSKYDRIKYQNINYFLQSTHHDLSDEINNDLAKKKGFILGSPRFSEEWLKIKSKLKLDGKNVPVNKKLKVKILFFIPKKHLNIFHEELIRTIDFISSYKEIDLILSCADYIYPDFPKKILKRENVRRFLIAQEYSTSKLIDWADIVIHAGTGVIFESFIKQKITVLPRYLTSNTLISEKYNAGLNLKNRDELRNLCNNAVKSLNNLKKSYNIKYRTSNKRYVNDFVFSNSNYIKKNIEKILLKILN